MFRTVLMLGSALALAGSPSLARADQCQLVDATVAGAARKLLPRGAVVIEYCEPCKGGSPGAPTAIATVDTAISHGKAAVRLDGKEIDLAYTYVKTGPATYTNVGLMVGCGADGVRGFLDAGPGTGAGPDPARPPTGSPAAPPPPRPLPPPPRPPGSAAPRPPSRP
jgi:hypothetical protein